MVDLFDLYTEIYKRRLLVLDGGGFQMHWASHGLLDIVTPSVSVLRHVVTDVTSSLAASCGTQVLVLLVAILAGHGYHVGVSTDNERF